jgi:hypothetical protein
MLAQEDNWLCTPTGDHYVFVSRAEPLGEVNATDGHFLRAQLPRAPARHSKRIASA